MIWSGNAYQELRREVRETRDIAVEARSEIRSHAVNCVEHNQRIEAMLREGRDIQNERHAENREAIGALRSQVMKMIISAMAAILIALVGLIVSIFAHRLGLT